MLLSFSRYGETRPAWAFSGATHGRGVTATREVIEIAFYRSVREDLERELGDTLGDCEGVCMADQKKKAGTSPPTCHVLARYNAVWGCWGGCFFFYLFRRRLNFSDAIYDELNATQAKQIEILRHAHD